MKDTNPNTIRSEPVKAYGISTALVALQLGPTDEIILNYMDFLASRIPIGTAYFIHVLPKFDLFNALYEREQESLVSNYELNDEVIGRMGTKIKGRITAMEANHIEFDVREGDPLEELLHDTEDLGADLVVIGQRAGKGYHGILAKNLARKADCNALIVPEKATKPEIRTIVVPVDFSSHSVLALRTALGIRRRLDEKVRVICLNVYDLPNFSMYRVQKSREEIKKMLSEDREEAFKNFIENYAPEDAGKIEIALVEREQPDTVSFILEFAEKEKADMIVIGAKGHSKVELLLLGSVTEKLLSENKQIPTLVVKKRP